MTDLNLCMDVPYQRFKQAIAIKPTAIRRPLVHTVRDGHTQHFRLCSIANDLLDWLDTVSARSNTATSNHRRFDLLLQDHAIAGCLLETSQEQSSQRLVGMAQN